MKAKGKAVSGDREARIAQIKAKLASINLGGGQAYFKPKVGVSTVRIMPGVGEMDPFFFQSWGRHYIGKTVCTCPNFTVGDPCPICEFVDGLYRAGDVESKELAADLRVSKQFAMNIIDRADEERGPQVWSPGPQAFGDIKVMFDDPDYADAIYDPDEGLDMRITRTGSTRTDTHYSVKASRHDSPLHPETDTVEKWLEAAIDLTPIELTDDQSEDAAAFKDEDGKVVAVIGVEPYERLKAEFESLDLEEVKADAAVEMPKAKSRVEKEKDEKKLNKTTPMPDEDEEEDEGVDEVRAVIQRRRAGRDKRR